METASSELLEIESSLLIFLSPVRFNSHFAVDFDADPMSSLEFKHSKQPQRAEVVDF